MVRESGTAVADVSTTYTLTTPGGTITCNAGTLGDGTDKYWLTSVNGLDGPVIRAPVDPVPFGDGGIVHTFRKGPRRPILDGMLLIESSLSQGLCQTLRNDLVTDLEAALNSILTVSGTLAWTPAGQAARSLAVFYEVGLSVSYSDNYAVANFSFGLVSEAADPT
jgi:hypothetical protein